jgi:hypothetical protein
LTEESIADLQFWLINCHVLPRKRLFSQNVLPDKIVWSSVILLLPLLYTDASNFACAGYTIETSSQIVHKMWSSIEASTMSTYRELKIVFITLYFLNSFFLICLVKLYANNQNVVRIIRAGSMKSELQDVAIYIFNICLISSISLEVEWVPREENQVADLYSKVFDYDDWSVSDRYFNYFYNIWDPFSCIVFADSNNFKVQVFCSPHWCPGTAGVDCFWF